LRIAIDIKLRLYLNLIIALKDEIKQAFTFINIISATTSIDKINVTLKRCVIWIKETTIRLQLINIIIEEIQSKFISTISMFDN